MWPFGKKVACFQCDTRVKEAASRLRRGFRFCTDACVQAFLAANPLRLPGGDVDEQRRELGILLVASLGELGMLAGSVDGPTHIHGSSGAVFTFTSAAYGSAVEQQRDQEAMDALYRVNSHMTEALPYLALLGLDADVEALDTIDLDALIRRAQASPAGAREVAAPLQRRLVAILERL